MANVDKVRICSLALNNIGAKSISSLEQPGKEAAVCREHYDVARLITLEGALWNFASSWKAGVRVDIAPKPTWSYCYAYPADALKVFSILRASVYDPAIPMEVTNRTDGKNGKLIQTNHISPVFEYTVDKEDVTTFSWAFINALSWHLAARIVMPITKSAKLLEKCEKNAIMFTADAEASSMNEGEQKPDDMGFYHEVRE